MHIPLTPMIMAVAGLLIYGFAGHPKASEAGRIIFFCGCLAVAMTMR